MAQGLGQDEKVAVDTAKDPLRRFSLQRGWHRPAPLEIDTPIPVKAYACLIVRIISKKGLLRLGILFLVLAGILFGAWWSLMRMPGESLEGPLPTPTPTQFELAIALKADVVMLAGTIGERNTATPPAFRRAADYLANALRAAGYKPVRDSYKAAGLSSDNLIAERKGHSKPDEIVVVGAHYDSVFGTPGANDNASGCAAVLALARHFGRKKATARTLRFVLFANEEPPFFQTDEMGSLVLARRWKKHGDNITAMFSLETIGWFRSEPDSQQYPVTAMKYLYGDKGDFIALVGNHASRDLVRQCVETFRKHATIPSRGIAMFDVMPGIGWSDHWAFWQQGWPALMVTDTAPFRYPYYHTKDDTPDKLDYVRMARVVAGLVPTIREVAEE